MGFEPHGLRDLDGTGTKRSDLQCVENPVLRRSRAAGRAASLGARVNSDPPISVSLSTRPISLDSRAGPRVLDVRGRPGVPAFRG